MLFVLCMIFVRSVSKKRLSKRREQAVYAKTAIFKIDPLHDINAGPYHDREPI